MIVCVSQGLCSCVPAKELERKSLRFRVGPCDTAIIEPVLFRSLDCWHFPSFFRLFPSIAFAEAGSRTMAEGQPSFKLNADAVAFVPQFAAAGFIAPRFALFTPHVLCVRSAASLTGP
jgi:hypothetical protein